MADSLLQALLEQSHQFTDEAFGNMDPVIRRLLISELYDALTNDPLIVPMVNTAIAHIKDDPDRAITALQEVFSKLATRIGEGFTKISE
jgi:hypothetical protein